MTNKERHQKRYQRRINKRLSKRKELLDHIGTAKDIFSYNKMFKYGNDCCKNVRWKSSVQNFERHLFSRTAINIHRVLDNHYNPYKLYPFTLHERGKIRHIEAPHIDDRQIQKTLTKEVLIPLYTPQMIYDNGASLRGKGLKFSQKVFDNVLREHIKKYNYNGWVIIVDFKGFFPNANRNIIKKKHKCIKDPQLQEILDIVTDLGHSDRGLPLGVEPSQLEMIAYTSSIDNFMSCQLGLKGFGHYMDDYHILVSPNKDPNEVLKVFTDKCLELDILISTNKTRIVPIGKSFKFCKIRRIFYSNKIIKRGSSDSAIRTRRKIKMFYKNQNKFTREDIYSAIQSSVAYQKQYNNHSTELKLMKLFYSLFNCTLTDYRKEYINEVHMS